MSKLNWWLGYSPDGVIIINGKPSALLEIKCVHKGKDLPIDEVIDLEFKKCLNKERTALNKKHKYYGQVHLGMFMLNVNKVYFAMHASKDDSMRVIVVPFDPFFTMKMLEPVKKTYFNIMIHSICNSENQTPKK